MGEGRPEDRAPGGQPAAAAGERAAGNERQPAPRSEPEAPRPAPAVFRPAVEVRVTLQRTPDAERDKRLLTWVYDLLRQRPGPDRFCIVLRINGNAMQLDFPNDSTTYDDELERQLNRRLGAGSVEVREIAD